jgi:hypothetical protein
MARGCKGKDRTNTLENKMANTTFELKAGGQTFVVDIAKWDHAYLMHACQYHAGVKETRCIAGWAKKGKTIAEMEEEERRVARLIVAGVLPSRGAGGSRLDDTDETDHRFLVMIGHKGKKSELKERLMGLARIYVTEDLDADEQARLLHADNAEELDELAEDAKDQMLADMRDSDEWKKIHKVVVAEKQPKVAIPVQSGKTGFKKAPAPTKGK